ncbi:COesterase domain-containing protein [Trichonephila clavipes]|nr:COesterase domain-containing protein [Trichonephila clavipes]
MLEKVIENLTSRLYYIRASRVKKDLGPIKVAHLVEKGAKNESDLNHLLPPNSLFPFVYLAAGRESSRVPVLVFIHGESYEWNAGNPYDGSVLASFGKVVVVTVNFRLGVLGKSAIQCIFF